MNGCTGAGQGVALGKDFTAVDEALLPQQLWNRMEWGVTVCPHTAPPKTDACVALSIVLSHAASGASSCSYLQLQVLPVSLSVDGKVKGDALRWAASWRGEGGQAGPCLCSQQERWGCHKPEPYPPSLLLPSAVEPLAWGREEQLRLLVPTVPSPSPCPDALRPEEGVMTRNVSLKSLCTFTFLGSDTGGRIVGSCLLLDGRLWP